MNVSRETPDWKSLTPRQILLQSASKLDINLSETQTDQLLDYFGELVKWNRRINLVGPGSDAEHVVSHLADSLAAVPYLDDPAADAVDLGTGPGLPGIVLKIMKPEWRMVLADSRSKKIDFLRHVARRLGLADLTVVETRFGPGDRRLPEAGFDLVTFRAVGALADMLPLMARYIRDNGRILAYKGPGIDSELENAADAMNRLDLVPVRHERFRLPFTRHERSLVWFARPGRANAL